MKSKYIFTFSFFPENDKKKQKLRVEISKQQCGTGILKHATKNVAI